MATQRISYALRLGGEIAPSLPRSFSLVSREVRQTQERIDRVTERQRELVTQLRNTKRGTSEYQRLQTEIEEAKREVEGLNGALARQNRAFSEITRRSRGLGLATAGAFGVAGTAIGGATLFLENQGREYARLQTSVRAANVDIIQAQRLIQLSRAAGFDLDPNEFIELANRVGEIGVEYKKAAQEGKKLEDATIGIAGETLRVLGFDPLAVRSEQVFEIIEAIRTLNDEEAAFAFQEIFGGAAGEQLTAIGNLSQETIDIINEMNFASEETVDQFITARTELMAFRHEIGMTGQEILSDMLPTLREWYSDLTPIVKGFADFVKNNPGVLKAIAGVGVGVAAILPILWALNTALAIKAALSGPAGWAALAVAAGLGVTGFVVGRHAINSARKRGEELQAEAADQQNELNKQIAINTQEGTEKGAYEGASRALIENNETLRNILPECPETTMSTAGEISKAIKDTAYSKDSITRDRSSDVVTPSVFDDYASVVITRPEEPREPFTLPIPDRIRDTGLTGNVIKYGIEKPVDLSMNYYGSLGDIVASEYRNAEESGLLRKADDTIASVAKPIGGFFKDIFYDRPKESFDRTFGGGNTTDNSDTNTSQVIIERQEIVVGDASEAAEMLQRLGEINATVDRS